MSITRNTFKLSSLSLAVLASLNMSAFAADEANDAEDEVEVIEVQGFRGSLIKSINDKKFAGNIVDTINAEDIGKSTDQNIADALGRVTGVSIVSQNGEGSQITVRGAGSNQNNISLNGQQLTSTEFSQSVDLSSFSADILSKLEVVKTPSADHDEGSLGANVNLTTVRPLNINREVRSVNLQARYSDFSEEFNHKLQFSMTEKFMDETLGVAVSAYSETNAFRRDEYKVERFEASSDFRIASDQNGDVISNVRGIVHNNTNYILSKDESNRYGGSLGIQFIPADTTELMLDLTYSKQDQSNQSSGIRTRHSQRDNFDKGNEPIDVRGATEFSDPQQDWYTVDTDTHTVTKYLNRFGSGDITSSIGGTENENFNATLNLKHDLSDTLRMSVLAGISTSESVSKPNAWSNMQNWRNIPSFLLFDTGEDIEPVGYDCTTGRCTITHGDGLLNFGTVIHDETDENGNLVVANLDNSATTGFHPSDLEAQHLAFISERDRTVEDTLKNIQVDFDYDLDMFGITTVEFGAKATAREKSVDNQLYNFNSNSRSENVMDSRGFVVAVPGGPITDVRGDVVALDEGLGYDNFMDSLGYGRSPATEGWRPADALKALSLVVSSDDAVRIKDDSETRAAQIDTQALYFKTNFDMFDGRLTGDFGVRYVKTEVDAQGNAGADFWNFGEDLERHIDFITVKNLRDRSLPECPTLNMSNPADTQGYEFKYQRIDGTGWDTTGGADPSTWTRIPDFGGDCHVAAWADRVETGDKDAHFVDWLTMWRFADVSTSKDYGWSSTAATPDVSWNGEKRSFDASPYSSNNPTDLDKSSFAVADTHEYSNVLPSLNLNFAFSDELIGRFAVSKSMTRPEIDLLRPGFKVTEAAYWGGPTPQNNIVSKTNTKLDPLESNNLDLSIEWYFNDVSMVSLALFSKDMSNFVDTDVSQTYLSDLRHVKGSFEVSELKKFATEDAASNYGLEGCMPQRTLSPIVWGAIGEGSLSVSNDYRELCGVYQFQESVNGTEATVRGVEVHYGSVFDFLPGALGGLGVDVNYTYQDSEYGSEASTVNPDETIPSMPVADTPEHTYNFTTFWEENGHQVRLSYRGSSDSLVGVDYASGDLLRGRNWNGGSIWNEGRNTFDLSANYKVSDSINISFQAINLTDESYRQYYTSRSLEVVRNQDADGNISFSGLDEGNPLQGEAPTHRTYREYKVGTTYRLGLNVQF